MRLKPGSELHQCAQCAYWEPALTYFGEPTGRGGCRFIVARNRKGSLLRECDKYQNGKKGEIKAKSQETKELESLIHFWKESLAQHRLLMSPSTIYLVEQTIKNLETLGTWLSGSSSERMAMTAQTNVVESRQAEQAEE